MNYPDGQRCQVGDVILFYVGRARARGTVTHVGARSLTVAPHKDRPMRLDPLDPAREVVLWVRGTSRWSGAAQR